MIPKFAVVGHPNKGKSSIVATLSQDDSVYIDRVSGSTAKAQRYPMAVNGETLYELIDTPGFQRARAALAWLVQHCDDMSQRPQAIQAFYKQHISDERFTNETQLLQPIIDGAGIIYVVDGSRPYGQEYEAEMEILRWTGKPSLAIINPIDNEDYVQDWNNALSQYFKTVRIFDAHRAEFIKRTSLLKVFGQLQNDWEASINKAVNCLLAERERQHRQASELIAALLVEVLQHKESLRIPGDIADGKMKEGIKQSLSEKYQQTIRHGENRYRRQVEENYSYFHLKRQENTLQLLDSDLFDQETWYLFGLSKQQLVTVGTGAGAGAGALIDIGLGGHSLLLGSIIGGLSGGIGAWTFSKHIAKITIKGLPTGGHIVHFGPSHHPNFPFVVLGRALYHLQLICTRTHAVRLGLSIDDSKPLNQFNAKEKAQLMGLFKAIRNNKKTFEQREKLADFIYQFSQRLDNLRADI